MSWQPDLPLQADSSGFDALRANRARQLDELCRALRLPPIGSPVAVRLRGLPGELTGTLQFEPAQENQPHFWRDALARRTPVSLRVGTTPFLTAEIESIRSTSDP